MEGYAMKNRAGILSLALTLCATILVSNLQGQELQWTPVDVEGIKGFERAYLEVPEKRGKAGSRTLKLMLTRMKSRTQPSGTPVVYLSGGPGGSAVTMVGVGYMRELFKRIIQHHDLILLEQRGTRFSEPALFWPSPESFPRDIFTTEERAIAEMRKRSELAVQYFREQGADLTGYTTVESADDIEALRKALGAPKLSLLSFSYGTHLTLATVKRHGDKLDRVVLAGTEGLDETLKFPSVYDRQLQMISDLAAEIPPIRQSVPNMKELFKKVLDQLERQPITVEVRDNRTQQTVPIKIGGHGLQFLLRLDIGDGNDFVNFPRVLYEIEQGKYEGIKRYAERRYNQLSTGISGLTFAMDLASWASSERIARIKEEAKTSLFGNTMNFPIMAAVDIWGNPDLGEDFRKPVQSNIPALFISGALDCQTPPHQAENILKGFPNGSHIVVQYAGHEDTLPAQEVQDAIVDFFNGKKPTITEVSLPRPVFTPIP